MQNKFILLLLATSFVQLCASDPAVPTKTESTAHKSTRDTTHAAPKNASTILVKCKTKQVQKQPLHKNQWKKVMIAPLIKYLPPELCMLILSYSLNAFITPLISRYDSSLFDITVVNYDQQTQFLPTLQPRGRYVNHSTFTDHIKEIYLIALKHLSEFQKLLEKNHLTQLPKNKIARAGKTDLRTLFLLNNSVYENKKRKTVINTEPIFWYGSGIIHEIEKTFKTRLPNGEPSMENKVTYNCQNQEFNSNSSIGFSQSNLSWHDFCYNTGSWKEKLMLQQIRIIHKDVFLNLQKIQKAIEQENGRKLTGALDLTHNYLTALNCNFIRDR